MAAHPPAAPANTAPPAAAGGGALRRFGPYQLLRLLGKSDRTSSWRATQPGTDEDLLLVVARQPLATGAAREMWELDMQRVERMDHPRLVLPLEVGQHDSLPYAVYDLRNAVPLVERLNSKGWPGAEAASALVQLLQGLAYAHDAGVAHHDIQTAMVLLDDGGGVRLAGLGVAAGVARHQSLSSGTLQPHRDAAERDVLTVGILLHQLLTGAPPLEEADTGRVITRLPPNGREMLRLSFTTAFPVSEILRAIANRATDRQPRQRYRNARTLMQALEGWMASENGNGGTLAQLQDRVRSHGVVPASPQSVRRARQLASMADDHTSDVVQIVLDEPALAYEIIRQANVAHVRRHGPGHGDTILSARRAIALLGLDAVHRTARSLKGLPAEARDAAERDLLAALTRARRAALLAVALRPRGYDPEAVYMVTLMQALGPLLLQHHFADEAAQIHRLMQPAPAAKPGDPDEPGMSEEGAAFAVLGTDLDTLGVTIARSWGLDETVLATMRRLSPLAPVRIPEGDHESLRTVASCALEVMDTLTLPAERATAGLQRIVARYGRVLGFTQRELLAMVETLPLEDGEAPLVPARPVPEAGGLRLVRSAGEAGDTTPGGLGAADERTALAARAASSLRARAPTARR